MVADHKGSGNERRLRPIGPGKGGGAIRERRRKQTIRSSPGNTGRFTQSTAIAAAAILQNWSTKYGFMIYNINSNLG